MLCRRAIDPALGKCGQPGILTLLLIQGELEKIDNFQAAELFLVDGQRVTELVRPSDERAIARDLVTFHGLSRCEHGRIPDLLIFDLADEFSALLDQPEDRLTGHALWRLA